MPATARDAPDSSAILGWLADTPAFKRAARDRAATIAAERSALIRDLRALETEAAAETPKLIAAVERITDGRKHAEFALRAVDKRLSTALVAKHNYGVAFGRRHDEIEASLRATASPLIASFVAEMRAAWDKTRRTPLTQETATTATKSAATGRPETYLKTNAAAVARRLRAIHETIRLAEELALSVADQSEIPALLGELAAKLRPMI